MRCVVRESCYAFYPNSPTMELCNGCSQKVQSFERWQKALTLRIVGS